MAITLLSYKSLYYYSRNNIEKVIIIKIKSFQCESMKIDHYNLGQGAGGAKNTPPPTFPYSYSLLSKELHKWN